MPVTNSKAKAALSKRKDAAAKAAPAKRAAPRQRRGYGGRSAEELRQERRARLIETGLQLFASRGYHRTQIELLCAQARVTTRHFYEEFSSREALLAAVYDSVIALTRRAVLNALQDPAVTPAERIASAIRAFVQAYTDDPRHARIACIEVVGVSEDMARRRRAVIHEFAQVVEAYANLLAQSGALPVRDYHLSCVAMVGAVNELMSEWLTVERPPSIEALTAELLQLFDAVLGGAQLLMRQTAPATSPRKT
jgi:AcrR family transcriptional regulator